MPLVMTADDFNGQDGGALLGWKAWTDVGGIYDSDRHNWADVPPDGMQVLFTYHLSPRPTRIAWSGCDEYSIPGDDGGTKLGRLMAGDAFLTLQLSAHADTWRPSGG